VTGAVEAVDAADLAARVLAGDRRALARAITLVESRRRDHRALALELLDRVLGATGSSVRVAITGTPGAGKSTLIEALGGRLCDAGSRVAVLAVDPTSRRSGGSILGDKTRMAELARRPEAFIRPSPAKDSLGGVARRTREALLLCEAAGLDVVVVETVGVGQSETAVADLVDTFVLLAAPGGGDELQGVKRGVMELADVVAVTKADGDLRAAAERSAADVTSALRFVRPRHPSWAPAVVTVSAIDGVGLDELWSAVLAHRAAIEAAGDLGALRADQAVLWFRDELTAQLLDLVRERAGGARIAAAEAAVRAGDTYPAPPAEGLVRDLADAGDRNRN
jgi:LAO/AO transport system kinase